MGNEGVALNLDGTQGSYENFFKTVKKSNVVPRKSTKHAEILVFSKLDYLHMDRHPPILFMYQLADNADATYESFVDRLKSSLAETLVTFYPMAGRVMKTADLDHPRNILLNDRGVPFTEAFLDSEMGPFLNLPNFEPISYLSGFEPAGLDGWKPVQQYDEEGNPAAFVQVTRFNCGGVIVAMTWNHMVADMTAAVSFLTAWSDISRTGSTTIVPEIDRSFLSAHSPSSSPTASIGTTPKAAPPPSSAAEAAKIEQVLKPKYAIRMLDIRKEPLDEIKREAKKERPEVSSMDCVSAHLWRSLAKVYAENGVTDTTVFTTAVEGRSRMELSPSYFGNAVVSATVRGVPFSEIISKPLSHAASLIRKAVKGITRETYWSVINEMDLRNPSKTAINRTDFQLGLVSWARFGLTEIDFGCGKPTYFAINLIAPNCRKGMCTVLPSALGEGYYSVCLCLESQIVEALWADPEFTSVC